MAVLGPFLIVCGAAVKYLRTHGTHQRTGIYEDAEAIGIQNLYHADAAW